MTGDINALARISYESGIDPIDYAEGQILLLMKAHGRVMLARTLNPAAFPGFGIELTPEALARRIIGNLLDAGWTAPVWPIPEPGACHDGS